MANTSGTQINSVEIISNMEGERPCSWGHLFLIIAPSSWRVSYVTAVPYSTLHVL
jgi:hypothetical protein